ncbi:hypothetical protein [Rugosimonospora africana]|uniref:Uncharacterized protein n=1 Tax=Rugosimonospora africana TaxID=556532 RepID=A0A8J3VRX4_9ACTN|nr:hypothetical protein [Rugosimonospora africana]GIH15838.1 hypothetical protein Raf01_40100 [Rugosimonospora africana]
MLTRKRLAAAGLTTALTAFTLTVTASPSYAATCTTSSHCYGEVEYYSSSAVYGLNQGLDVRCLGPMGASTSSNFVTEEMWLATNNGSGNYWVETGMAYGAPQGSTRYWFWADNRPNGGGYHEHDLTISTAFGTTYDDYITWVGNNSWQVRRDSTTLGTSTANPGSSHGGNAGEELTVNSGSASAITEFLFKQTSSGGIWTNNWPGASVRTDNPPYGGWESTGYSADFYSNCGFGPADPGPSFTPFTAAAAPTALTTIVSQLSASNGVATPRSVSYVLTTRQAAAKLTSQAVVDSDQPVYLVSLRGAFSAKAAKTPRGAAKPTGEVMTVAIDPATGRITDWGIESAAPGLATLGAVRQLS